MNFVAEDDRLTVVFKGSEKLWALKSRLVIPRSKIISLAWQPNFRFEGRIIRLGGADVPGMLYAGRYRGGGENYFLYLVRPRGGLPWLSGAFETQNTLIITTRDFPYKNIFLTCNPDIGAGLLNWWAV